MKRKKVHFMRIGRSGLARLVLLAQAAGFKVSGRNVFSSDDCITNEAFNKLPKKERMEVAINSWQRFEKRRILFKELIKYELVMI